MWKVNVKECGNVTDSMTFKPSFSTSLSIFIFAFVLNVNVIHPLARSSSSSSSKKGVKGPEFWFVSLECTCPSTHPILTSRLSTFLRYFSVLLHWFEWQLIKALPVSCGYDDQICQEVEAPNVSVFRSQREAGWMGVPKCLGFDFWRDEGDLGWDDDNDEPQWGRRRRRVALICPQGLIKWVWHEAKASGHAFSPHLDEQVIFKLPALETYSLTKHPSWWPSLQKNFKSL